VTVVVTTPTSAPYAEKARRCAPTRGKRRSRRPSAYAPGEPIATAGTDASAIITVPTTKLKPPVSTAQPTMSSSVVAPHARGAGEELGAREGKGSASVRGESRRGEGGGCGPMTVTSAPRR
jgi:hypothetical protein